MAQWTTPEYRDEQGGVLVPSGIGTVLLGPFCLPYYETRSFTLYNLGPATLSGAVIQINPDHTATPPNGTPNAGLWHTYDATAFQSLAPGEVRSKTATDVAYRWWRIVGTNDRFASLTASGWLMGITR